ncbi:MAG: SMP-30/gluconolactonase/LRE family protein [Acetobacteraceae bacterium]
MLLFGAGRSAVAAGADIIASGLGYTEGTIFVGETLYFVDYSNSDVLRLNGGKVEQVWHQDGCGANGLVQLGRALLVACYNNNTVVKISLDGQTLQTITADDAGKPFDRPNDLALDAKGGVYFTGSGEPSNLGRVYYLTPGGQVKDVADNIQNANGLVVSPNGKTLYVAESYTDSLLTYSIAADGGLGDRRLFLKLGDILGNRRSTPDGVRLDKHGRLFIGLYNGGGFAVITLDGKLVTTVDLPGPHHANLAISPDGRFVYGTIAYDEPDGSYRGALYRTPNPVSE